MSKDIEQYYQKTRNYIEKYHAISDAEWAQVKVFLSVKTLSKGDVFYDYGDIANEAAFIVKGCMRAKYQKSNDSEQVLAFMLENHFIAAPQSILLNAPIKIKWEAFEDSILICIHKDFILAGIKNNEKVQAIMQVLSLEALNSIEGFLDYFLSNSPEERYNSLISKNTEVLQRIPQYAIAEMLNISPVSLSRIRARMFKKK